MIQLDLPCERARLEGMTVGQLAKVYEEIVGEPPRSRHKAYLIRRVAWRLQARAEGDLSERARRRAVELADDAQVRLNEVIRAVLLSASEAKHLQTTAKSPALEVVSIGYLEDDSPLWWERTLYRGDQYEFHSRLGPIQSATPARGKLR